MSRLSLVALAALSLAACTVRDPQRTDAYAEMTPVDTSAAHEAAHDTSAAHGGHALPETGPHSTAEAIAQYDVASTAPQPNLNTGAMRGMPLPDTATRGWAATGKHHRQPGAAH